MTVKTRLTAAEDEVNQVFVHGLRGDMTDERLRAMFADFHIDGVSIVRDPVQPRQVSHGFLEFADKDEAQRCIREANFRIAGDGRMCRLNWSVVDKSLLNAHLVAVKGLPSSANHLNIDGAFKLFGRILSARIEYIDDTNECSGNAWISFADGSCINRVMQEAERGIVVAGSVVAVERTGTAQSSTLYLKGFHKETTEEMMLGMLRELEPKPFGVHVRASKDGRPYAFANYQGREAATQVGEQLHYATINELCQVTKPPLPEDMRHDIKIDDTTFLPGSEFSLLYAQPTDPKTPARSMSYREATRTVNSGRGGEARSMEPLFMVYARNVPVTLDEAGLINLFSLASKGQPEIEVKNIRTVIKNGQPSGVVFIGYDNSQDAQKVITRLNGLPLDYGGNRQELFVCKLQRRGERRARFAWPPAASHSPQMSYAEVSGPNWPATPATPVVEAPAANACVQESMDPQSAVLTNTELPELTGLSNEERKKAIGNALWGKVNATLPRLKCGLSLCGKITGMLLEMPEPVVLALLESNNMMENAVSDALQVLNQHPYPSANVSNEIKVRSDSAYELR